MPFEFADITGTLRVDGGSPRPLQTITGQLEQGAQKNRTSSRLPVTRITSLAGGPSAYEYIWFETHAIDK
jgi:hypothetical protein